eukprot:m.166775 g.166775  ORF g.166775 m.166775 type:complete len:169 (-) comp18169_c0_seq1:21-527(-)
MAESRTSVSESPSRPSMRSRKTTPAEKDSARFDDAVAKKEERQETHNRRFDGSTIVWLLLCIGVIHKFDIIDAVRYDPRINRESLQLAAVLMAVSIAVAAYSIVFVHGVLGKDYLDHSPWAVPLASLSGLLGWGMFWVCMWPVWGWTSFFIIPCLFMGLLLGVTLIPL